VGRVFQSCIGYERVTYGLRGPGNVPLDLVTVANALPEQDLIASFYFGIVHLLRAMVYVPTATATLLLDECVGRLIEEVTWRL
jgi:hypothetical protein